MERSVLLVFTPPVEIRASDGQVLFTYGVNSGFIVLPDGAMIGNPYRLYDGRAELCLPVIAPWPFRIPFRGTASHSVVYDGEAQTLTIGDCDGTV